MSETPGHSQKHHALAAKIVVERADKIYPNHRGEFPTSVLGTYIAGRIHFSPAKDYECP